MVTQVELDYIIEDTSIDGEYIKFYEMLQNSLSYYSDERIDDMKDTLKFVHPNLDIDSMNKMEVIYEYSKLI